MSNSLWPPGYSLSMGFSVLCTVCPLFMGFSRQEYWSGLSCPPPEGLPDLGIEPLSLTSLALAGRFFISNTTWETPCTAHSKNQVYLCRRLNEHEKNPLIYQSMCLLSTPLEQRSLWAGILSVLFSLPQGLTQQLAPGRLNVQAGFRKGRGTEIKLPTSADHRKSKRVPEKHLFLLYWLYQTLWLCGSQLTVENSERDSATRPSDLPIEKPVCRSGSNS